MHEQTINERSKNKVTQVNKTDSQRESIKSVLKYILKKKMSSEGGKSTL